VISCALVFHASGDSDGVVCNVRVRQGGPCISDDIEVNVPAPQSIHEDMMARSFQGLKPTSLPRWNRPYHQAMGKGQFVINYPDFIAPYEAIGIVCTPVRILHNCIKDENLGSGLDKNTGAEQFPHAMADTAVSEASIQTPEANSPEGARESRRQESSQSIPERSQR